MNGCLSSFFVVFLLNLVLLSFCPMCTVAASTGQYASDVVFVKTAIETCLGEKFSIIPLKAGESIAIQSMAEDKKNWLIEDALIRHALDRGLHVTRSVKTEEVPQEIHTLSFRLVDLALNCFVARPLSPSIVG